MASLNTNAPFGFRLVRNANGDFPKIEPYTAASSVTLPEGAIGILGTAGTITTWDGTYVDARKIVGVIQTKVSTTQTDRQVFISNSPEAEYEVQMDDGSVTGIGGLIGRNFNSVSEATRNNTLIQSKAALDASTGSSLNGTLSTNSAPFRALRFSGEVGNVNSNSFARVIVKINHINQIFAGATTTV